MLELCVFLHKTVLHFYVQRDFRAMHVRLGRVRLSSNGRYDVTDVTTGRLGAAFDVAMFSRDTVLATACSRSVECACVCSQNEPFNRTPAFACAESLTHYSNVADWFFVLVNSTSTLGLGTFALSASRTLAIALPFTVRTKARVAVHGVFHVRSGLLHHPTVVLSLGHTFVHTAQFLCCFGSGETCDEDAVDATNAVGSLVPHLRPHETPVLDCVHHFG